MKVLGIIGKIILTPIALVICLPFGFMLFLAIFGQEVINVIWGKENK